jgi:hypothetical protein
MKIQLSSDVSFPLSFVTNTTAVLARRGAGKSYTASVIAEQVMEAEQPVIILDPLGAFWGLRSSADGKRPGYAVIVLGGRHGDVPLEPTAGKVVAALVVDKPGWYVLDLSLFESGAAQDRFAGEFLEALYRLKAGKPTAQLLIIDEADSFAPQRPGPQQLHMLGAMESIVRRGRSRGLGMVMISQRAAVLNKNVLTQAENLIIMQTTGPQDIAAIELWIEHSGQGGLTHKVLSSLPSLDVGECWVWSPANGLLDRTKIQKRVTFDSSATPKPGETRVEPQKRADVDLEILGAEIKATIERAKENDPTELRAKIRRLEAELAKKPAPTVERVTTPIISSNDLEILHGLSSRLNAVGTNAALTCSEVQRARESIEQIHLKVDALKRPAEPKALIGRTLTDMRFERLNPKDIIALGKSEEKLAAQIAGPLTGPQQKILAVVWMLGERGLTPNREMVARWLDLHPNGGTYNTNLGFLRKEGYLDGFNFLPKAADTFTVMRTGFDASLDPLNGSERKIMLKLFELPRAEFTRDTLAAALELHPNGGTYNTCLGRLRCMGLIPERGTIKLTEAALR